MGMGLSRVRPRVAFASVNENRQRRDGNAENRRNQFIRTFHKTKYFGILSELDISWHSYTMQRTGRIAA